MPNPLQTLRLARFEGFSLDLRAGELHNGGKRIRLQDKPLRMLRLLLERSGEVVTREELQKTLWPGGTVVEFDQGIATALKKLRRALRDDADHPRYIETLARRGYRWIAGAEWVESGEKPKSSNPAAQIINSIAVLPFANLGGDPEQDYFCDGLAEEILNALTRIPGLRVTARTSSFSFRGEQQDIRQVGQALNVRSILEGGVRRSGNRIRITVQLIDVATGYHLWSGTIEPEAHDTWAVQEQIARAIVAAIQLELRPEERRTSADTHRPHPEAFELYLKARYASEYMQEASQRKAVGMFQSAIASDPFYSLPLVGLARCYLNLTALNLVPPSEVVPHARAALGRALALDPNLPEAHGLMANTIARHEWDWPRAEQHFLRALELAPHSAVVHHEFSIACLVPQGRLEQGLAENRRARELEPLRPSFVRSYIWLLIHARQFGEAERECRRLIAEGRDPAYFRNHLGLVLFGQRRLEEACAELKAAVAGGPNPEVSQVNVAIVQANLGQRAAAEELLEHLQEQAAVRYVPATSLAFLNGALGREEEALAALERACLNREYSLVSAKVFFLFDAFRRYSRFQAILRELHLG